MALRNDRRGLLRPAALALALIVAAAVAMPVSAAILVPMDLTQTNHLKAYGLAYRLLARACRWSGCSIIAAAPSCSRTAPELNQGRALGARWRR